MTAPLVERVNARELLAERSRIVARHGGSEADFLDRGESWALATENEWQDFERLRGIRFLLGEGD